MVNPDRENQFTFVLIRGLTRSVEHWDDFPEILGRAFPGSRILRLELPGNGRLHARKSPLKISSYVEALRRELLEEIDPADHRIIFVAISLGGMIASEWMHLYPKDSRGAVLIVTSSGRVSPPWRRLRPSSISTALSFLFTRTIRGKEHVALKRVSNRTPTDGLLDRYTHLARIHPVSATNTLRQIGAAALYFRSFKHPSDKAILFLGSQGDRLVSPSCTIELGKSTGHEYHMHPDAGHEVPLDDPEWVVDRIQKFLS